MDYEGDIELLKTALRATPEQRLMHLQEMIEFQDQAMSDKAKKIALKMKELGY